MKTLQELLDKLDTFNVVKATRSDNELHFSNGLKAAYKVDTHKQGYNCLTFQAVLYVRLTEDENGYMPYSWGCTSEEDNKLLVQWFYKKSSLSLAEQSDRVQNFTSKIRDIIEG